MDVQTLLNSLWVVMAAALVFFMQAGFSMVESGLTRTKNSINVAIKNLTDLGVSVMVYWVFGFALMFGDSISGWFGASSFLPDFTGPARHGLAVFFLFQAMFCSTSATIVSGAVAERMRYSSYIISTLFLSALIYPVFGHWAWGGFADGSTGSGWLAAIGFVDFAGSTVVHSVGGYVALALLLILGPRAGRFVKGEKPRRIPGSNIPLSVGGVIVLWFGWIGFNGGSTFAMTADVPSIIINTCLAAGAGLITALLVGWAVTKIPDVNFVMNGTLAGLVAITAGCHAVSAAESVLIGAVAGIVMLAATAILEKLRIDDAVGAIPVHLAAGIWGTLAVGIFSTPAIVGTTPVGGSQLLAQAIGVGACALWAFGVSFPVLWVVNKVQRLRVTAQEEHSGLNIAEHGASTEIFELYATMDEQAKTGDLSMRLPVEPFTEVGQIAEMYNRVIAGLEMNTIAREEFTEIFNNVSDALFLLDRDYRICPNYSKATEKVFAREQMVGQDMRTVIDSMVSPEKGRRFRDFIELMFDRQHHERSISSMNPLTATHFKVHMGYDVWEPRLLDFSFHRVWDASKTRILHVLVVGRDITRTATLAAEVRRLRTRLGELESKDAVPAGSA